LVLKTMTIYAIKPKYDKLVKFLEERVHDT
jgi:hypothetical protein